MQDTKLQLNDKLEELKDLYEQSVHKENNLKYLIQRDEIFP